MGKIVVESGTIDSEKVGFKPGCGRCPSGCRTACQRRKSVEFEMVEGEMDDFKLSDYMPDYGSFRHPKKAEEE